MLPAYVSSAVPVWVTMIAMNSRHCVEVVEATLVVPTGRVPKHRARRVASQNGKIGGLFSRSKRVLTPEEYSR